MCIHRVLCARSSSMFFVSFMSCCCFWYNMFHLVLEVSCSIIGDKPNLPFQRVCLTRSTSPDESSDQKRNWEEPTPHSSSSDCVLRWSTQKNLTFWVEHVSYQQFTFADAGLFLPEPDPSLGLGARSRDFFSHVNTFLPEVYEHAVVRSRFSKMFRACISNRSPHCGLWKTRVLSPIAETRGTCT